MTTDSSILRSEPLGDSATLLRMPDSPEGFQLAHTLGRAVRAARIHGIRDAVTAYSTLAVYFDPLLTTTDEVDAAVRELESGASPDAVDPGQLFEISVTYDGADLDFVADAARLSRAEVAALHASVEYVVQAVGFAPGFAYLGDLPAQLRMPRRDTPRPRVAVGSVAIAGAQTAVYPLPTPGGWHLIGTTDLRLFDSTRTAPALLSVGDRVRFVPR